MYALNTRRFRSKSRFSTPRCLGTRFFHRLNSSLSFDQCAHLPPLAEKLCSPHLIHRVVGVLEDVELVIDYAAPRHPLLQAETKRLPHIYAGRLDAFPLPASQLSSEVFVQRLFLPFPSHPQGLAGFQIAHYSEKLVLLSPVNLIHSHLLERRLAAMLVPPLEVAHVDSPHSGLRQLE